MPKVRNPDHREIPRAPQATEPSGAARVRKKKNRVARVVQRVVDMVVGSKSAHRTSAQADNSPRPGPAARPTQVPPPSAPPVGRQRVDTPDRDGLVEIARAVRALEGEPPADPSRRGHTPFLVAEARNALHGPPPSGSRQMTEPQATPPQDGLYNDRSPSGLFQTDQPPEAPPDDTHFAELRSRRGPDVPLFSEAGSVSSAAGLTESRTESPSHSDDAARSSPTSSRSETPPHALPMARSSRAVSRRASLGGAQLTLRRRSTDDADLKALFAGGAPPESARRRFNHAELAATMEPNTGEPVVRLVIARVEEGAPCLGITTAPRDPTDRQFARDLQTALTRFSEEVRRPGARSIADIVANFNARLTEPALHKFRLAPSALAADVGITAAATFQAGGSHTTVCEPTESVLGRLGVAEPVDPRERSTALVFALLDRMAKAARTGDEAPAYEAYQRATPKFAPEDVVLLLEDDEVPIFERKLEDARAKEVTPALINLKTALDLRKQHGKLVLGSVASSTELALVRSIGGDPISDGGEAVRLRPYCPNPEARELPQIDPKGRTMFTMEFSGTHEAGVDFVGELAAVPAFV